MRTITRKELYQYEQECIQFKNQYPFLALMLQDKIGAFYRRNQMQFKVMSSRFDAIKEKFVQKDDRGNFLTVKNGDEEQWKFIETGEALAMAGVLDLSLVEKRFNEECEKLFSQQIQIDW